MGSPQELKRMTFNSVDDIDKLIEAIERLPEKPKSENTAVKGELSRREKMLQTLRELRKEADELTQSEKIVTSLREENDAIDIAVEKVKQLVKTKKQVVTRKTTPLPYGGNYSSESRSGESRSSSGWGSWTPSYSCGESRCDGESRW